MQNFQKPVKWMLGSMIPANIMVLFMMVAVFEWHLIPRDYLVPAFIGIKLIPYIIFGWEFPVEGFWKKVLAGLLGISRIGYEQPGINILPWKFILGIIPVIILMDISVITLLLSSGDVWEKASQMAIFMISSIAGIIIAYFIGHVYRTFTDWADARKSIKETPEAQQ